MHDVDTGSAHLIRLPPYLLPHAYREAVHEELKEMLADGLITPSESAWSAPIVPVKKKDGSLKLCVEYHHLDVVSRFDAYPMPRVDDLIDRLGKAKYISTIDLARGYWQVPLAEGAQEKTAFATPFGLFQFTVMPFGLQDAPATFQRLMDRLIDGMEDHSGSYIDDLVIYSETWEEHLQHVRAVLTRLREANLTAKATLEQQSAPTWDTGLVEVSYALRSQSYWQSKLWRFCGRRRMCVPSLELRVSTTGLSLTIPPLTDLTRKSAPNRVVWDAGCT